MNDEMLQQNLPIFLPLSALGLCRKLLVGFVSEKSDRFKETQKVFKNFLSKSKFIR